MDRHQYNQGPSEHGKVLAGRSESRQLSPMSAEATPRARPTGALNDSAQDHPDTEATPRPRYRSHLSFQDLSADDRAAVEALYLLSGGSIGPQRSFSSHATTQCRAPLPQRTVRPPPIAPYTGHLHSQTRGRTYSRTSNQPDPTLAQVRSRQILTSISPNGMRQPQFDEDFVLFPGPPEDPHGPPSLLPQTRYPTLFPAEQFPSSQRGNTDARDDSMLPSSE